MRSSSRKTPIHLKCTTALINHPQRARAVAAATRRARIRAQNLEWAVQKVLWPTQQRSGEKKERRVKDGSMARYRIVEVQVQRQDEDGRVQAGDVVRDVVGEKGKGKRDDRNMEGNNAGLKKKGGKRDGKSRKEVKQ